MKYFLNLTMFLVFFLIFSCKADQIKIIIAKFDSGTVNQKESIDEYNGLTDEEKLRYGKKDDFFRLVRKISLEKIIINKSLKDGLDKGAEFSAILEESKKKYRLYDSKTKKIF